MQLKCNHIFCFLLVIIITHSALPLFAQNDTVQHNRLDSLLLKQKGLLGQLAQSLMTDTFSEVDRDFQRADLPFQNMAGRVIRKIIIQPLDFGISIGDTSKFINNRLTRLADKFHRNTRPFAIRNNLFFREYDRLSPFLLGNNERYLRDLPFLQEASIMVKAVRGTRDSVDVTVFTKDVLSIGGGIDLHNPKSVGVHIEEDNLGGWGDRLKFNALYDQRRQDRFGFGGEFVKRNIAGSFIDGSAGYLNFNKTFNTGSTEEALIFARFIKPLVNPYMLFTYGLTGEMHHTSNLFNTDSIYKNDHKYKYHIYDAWGGWNLSNNNIGFENEFSRLRYLIGARVLDQNFLSKPLRYQTNYNYQFADLFAVLGSISVFKLNYYKTRYIYGFGRREDIPQGLEASITTGWTRKENRERNYVGFAFQRYHLTKKEAYFNYTLRAASYLYQKKLEDINLLANLDYFSSLIQLNPKWKQRVFLNASFARQFNRLLEEPLRAEGIYGIDDFDNARRGGKMRLTTKAESVFFSPWSILFFKMAPFVFSSATLFRSDTLNSSNNNLYTAVGGGVRTRNESLVFGTIELKGVYFPKKDLYNNRYKIELSANLRFKYNQNFIRRPEFVQVN